MRKLNVFLLVILFTGLSSKVWGQKDDVYQKTGDALMAVKDFKLALDNYNKAIKKAGNDTTAANLYTKRAICYLALNELQLCKNDCDKAIKIDTANGTAYFTRARCYDAGGSYISAVNNYRRVIYLLKQDDNKSRSLIYSDIALDYLNSQLYDEALKNDSLAISADPQYGRAYWISGLINAEIKHYQYAIDAYTSCLMYINQNNENNKNFIGKLYYKRAIVNFLFNKYKAAIDDYSHSILLNPDEITTYIDRAKAYEKNTDYELAIEDYTRVISRYPDKSSNTVALLYTVRATDELKASQYLKAVQDDSLALKSIANDAQPYLDLAAAYHWLGNYKFSDSTYKICFGLLSSNVVGKVYGEIKSLEAENAYFLNKNDSVLTYCNYAITKDKYDVRAFFYRGKVFTKLNKPDLGLKDFSAVIALDSTKKSSYYLLSLFYLGQSLKSEEILKNEILASTNNSDLNSYYYTLACLYSLMNKQDEANVYLIKAIDGGYTRKFAMADDNFNNIRNSADYKAIMAEVHPN